MFGPGVLQHDTLYGSVRFASDLNATKLRAGGDEKRLSSVIPSAARLPQAERIRPTRSSSDPFSHP
jgi:hypothetical protein